MLASSATSCGFARIEVVEARRPPRRRPASRPGPRWRSGSASRSPADVAPPSRSCGERTRSRTFRPGSAPRSRSRGASPPRTPSRACRGRGRDRTDRADRPSESSRTRGPGARDTSAGRRGGASARRSSSPARPRASASGPRQCDTRSSHAPWPGLPRREPEVGLVPLPALDRPVRAVARRARGDEERERRAAVRPARVAKLLPDRLALGPPAARVVDAELRLRLRLARCARVQRTPHEHALEPTLSRGR